MRNSSGILSNIIDALVRKASSQTRQGTPPRKRIRNRRAEKDAMTELYFKRIAELKAAEPNPKYMHSHARRRYLASKAGQGSN